MQANHQLRGAWEKVQSGVRNTGEKVAKTIGVILSPSEELGANEAASIRKKAGRLLGFAFLGFLLSRAEFFAGTYPFGLAFLFAGGAETTLPTAFGAVIGALFRSKGRFISVFIYTLSTFSRYLLSKIADGWAGKGIFGEDLKIRIVTSAAMGFVFGMEGVFRQGFSMTSVVGLLLMTLLSPLFCIAYRYVFEKKRNGVLYAVSLGFLLFSCIFALKSREFLGFSLAGIASVLAIMYIASRAGMFFGAFAGVISALAFDASAIAPLASVGLSLGALWQLGAGTAVGASLAIGTAIGIFSEGIGSIFGISGDILFSGLLFLPAARAKIFAIGKPFPGTSGMARAEAFSANVRKTDEMHGQITEKNENEHLHALSKAFDELSELFLSLSEKMRMPGSSELYALCDAVMSKECRKCVQSSVCWKKDYASTADVITKMVGVLRSGGALSPSDIPGYFRLRCKKTDDIIARINTGAAELLEKNVGRDKTELFALDYAALSQLLRETAEMRQREYVYDPKLGKIFADTLSRLGIASAGAAAFGTGRKIFTATGVDMSSVGVSADVLKKKVGEAVGTPVSEPMFSFTDGISTLQFETLPLFEVTGICACRQKNGENVSGDVCGVFNSIKGSAFALISDGMGSGQQAAMAARITAVFLEKMLKAGNSKYVTLRLLSDFIRARADECHATVDLLEIDTHTGKAEFAKSGACASYLIRSGSTYRMEATSLPLGITREINTKTIDFSVQDGDRIVMVSDGVTSDGVSSENNSREDNSRLSHLLVSSLPAKELADKIVAGADTTDDASVIVIEIRKRN